MKWPQLALVLGLVISVLWLSRSKPETIPSPIQAGIVPHHLLARSIINDFFARLSSQNVKTIILLGPNHLEKGDSLVLSGLNDWMTDLGPVKVDTQLVQSLVDEDLVKIDDQIVKGDQSMDVIPIIKVYLPEVQVAPLILSGFMSQEDVERLALAIERHMNNDTVVVGSVDFSHYLTSEEAKSKDKETMLLMQDFNYSQLLKLNSDHLDSPPAIVTLLMVVNKLNLRQMEVLAHTNSGIMQHNPNGDTTSYFSIVYY